MYLSTKHIDTVRNYSTNQKTVTNANTMEHFSVQYFTSNISVS